MNRRDSLLGPESKRTSVRGRRGTTLIEILVVIVIFLVGILAVVQIFPRGFRILFNSRNNSMSTALAQDFQERLQARPDELPEEVLPIAFNGTANVLLPDWDPNNLGPVAGSMNQAGHLISNGVDIGYWPLASGANVFRRILGESHVIPAPRAVGSLDGGVLVLPLGPIDFGANPFFAVYGPDLTRQPGIPNPNKQRTSPDQAFFDVRDPVADFQYFAQLIPSGSADIFVPAGPTPRSYRIRFSGYVAVGGGFAHRDFIGSFAVPATTQGSVDGTTMNYPVFEADIGQVVGASLASVDYDSIRVARNFVLLPTNQNFDDGQGGNALDPYEVKLIDSKLGVLLFNPGAYNAYIDTPGGRQPLTARCDYDVFDWRVLHDEFRIPDDATARVQLSVGSLVTSTTQGPDGISTPGIMPLETSPTSASNDDHFALVDMDTGGLYFESRTGIPLITLDKTLGIVTLQDADSSRAGIQAWLLLPDGTTTEVDAAGRAVRALYMSRGEWAVQMLKAASSYSVSPTRPTVGEYYVGGTDPGVGGSPVRIYFPRMDNGQKVSIDELYYIRSGDNQPRTISGQEFVVRFPRTSDGVGLPCIDITDIDPQAISVDTQTYGTAAKGVKGASIMTRVTWNPDAFHLSSGENISKLDQWGRGTRHSTTETFLERGELR
jgi:type II secretory pathway pseudopilin PulG